MSREATAPSAHAGGDAAANGGYLGTLSNLFTSLAADATASATRAEDRVLDAVEAGLEGVVCQLSRERGATKDGYY